MCPGEFAGDGTPTTPFVARSGLRVVGKVTKKTTGTRIRFWADRRSSCKDAEISLDELHTRARQTAFLVPGLTLVVQDDARPTRSSEETFRYDGGISEFCEFLAPDEPVSDVLRLQGVGHFKETVPVLDAKGHMTPAGGRARARRRRRAALGHRLRHRRPLLRQHHRHPQGRHPPVRASSGP